MGSLPVLFDPALLAFIPIVSREEFVTRVSFIVRWAQIIGTTDVNIQIAPETRELFIRNGLFPAHASVEQALNDLNLRYRYAPQDIIGAINTIFSRAAEGFYCCVRDEMHSNFTSIPTQPWHNSSDLNAQTQRTILLAMIEKQLHADNSKLVLASTISAQIAQFSGYLEMVEPGDLTGFEDQTLPRNLTGELAVASNFEDVLDQLRSQDLWNAAENNADIKLAIWIRCRERLKSVKAYKSKEDIPVFFVGSDFYSSLTKNQSAGSGRFASITLECCSSAVLESPNFEWKIFNKNNRLIDNALPLRAHLSEGNMALRLMAWRRPKDQNGTCLEFSNIGPKWEEEISNTEPTEAV